MPLDNLGCTCATMKSIVSICPDPDGKSSEKSSYQGSFLVIVDR